MAEVKNVFGIRELFNKIKDNKQVSIFEHAWDSVPTLMFIKDLNNILIKVNNSLCIELGLPKEEVEFKNPEEYLWPNGQISKYFENDLEVIGSKSPKLNILEDINGKPVITNKYPIFDCNSNVIGILGLSNKR